MPVLPIALFKDRGVMGRVVALRGAFFGLAAVGLLATACVHKETAPVAVAEPVAAPVDVGAVKRGDNLYDVVYIGDEKGSTEYVRDMTLYQSAELCQSQGFEYFRASHTPAYSTHEAPEKPVTEQPKLTMQVSCLLAANDATISYGVNEVIDRVRLSYNLK
jgi:hypothetical protein